MAATAKQALIALAALLALGAGGTAIAGCGTGATGQGPGASGGAPTGAQGDRLPQGDERAELDPANFTTEIDNPYWPMRPGTKWTYESVTKGVKKKVVVEVTDKTKRIANGVEARVVRDISRDTGKPTEVTDDWYAQDRAGNIWYLGEATAEYENGKLKTRAGSFEAGVNGAQAGVALPADPRPGMAYRQEYYKGEAEDKGAIVTVGDEQVDVPFGFVKPRDIVMTRDLVPTEPKVQELKFYARGVGPVLTVHTDHGASRTELLSYTPGG